MPYTYFSDEFPNDISVDSSSIWSIKRNIYFKPDEYSQFISNPNQLNKSDLSLPIQLYGSTYIPKYGDNLSAVLSATNSDKFTFFGEMTLENISQLQGIEASFLKVSCTYSSAKPTIGQSNATATANASADENGNLTQKPWEQTVNDFSVSRTSQQLPFEKGYYNKNFASKVDVKNTAGQKITGTTYICYGYSISWTYATKSSTSYMTGQWQPIVNSAAETLPNGLRILAKQGLFLPPTPSERWYIDDTMKKAEKYRIWSFEILVSPNGHAINLMNMGTKARFATTSNYDIASWYSIDASQTSGVVSPIYYGTVSDWLQAERNIAIKNNSIKAGQPKNEITGGPVTDPVPLTLTGDIDFNALNGVTQIQQLSYDWAIEGSWNYGWR